MRFIGGMRYRARGGLFSGGANLGWPLAALELSADSIKIAPRWLANRVLPPVEIPLSEITVVETAFGFSRAGVRFRLSGPADGTVFWAAGRTRSLLVDELRRAGLNVQ